MIYVMRLAEVLERLIDTRALYLRNFDPEARGGRGDIGLTDNPNEAVAFPKLVDLFELWKQTSHSHPIRLTDGRPNRPLTSFNMEPVPMERAQALWKALAR
jgi:hypothetical protein